MGGQNGVGEFDDARLVLSVYVFEGWRGARAAPDAEAEFGESCVHSGAHVPVESELPYGDG
eukprot:2229839-Pyramimonas_sp.AAC.1